MSDTKQYDGALEEVVGKKQSPKQFMVGGWQDINMSLLSYKGVYYPEDTVISVKPFSTKEVIQFTSINEKNPLEVDKAMRYLIDECVQVRVKGRIIKAKDIIFNIDRFSVILLARLYSDMRTDLTFENSCSVSKCNHEQKIKVIPQNLVYSKDVISKYFDGKSSVFKIQMKSVSGNPIEVEYSPTTISENTDLFDFMMGKRDEIEESELKVLSKIFPFMRKEIDKCESMSDVYLAFKDLSKDNIIDYSNLADKVVLDFNNKVSTKCGDCGHMEDVPMRFPDGIGVVVVDKNTDDDFLL